jgi:hypothetical protein
MNYDAILANPAETIFKVEGQGVQVLSENEFLALTGQRIHTGQSQGPTKSYAQDFTKHFNALCQKYPALGQLRNVFDLALISTLIYQQTQTGIARWSPNYFCGESHSASSLRYSIESVPTPQNVMSVVNHRYFDTHQGGRHFRHMVVGVGGGVEFDAPRLIKSSLNKTTPSDQLENVAAQSAAPKNDPSQWWWD